ncbi:MAG TPA: DUF6391 domain-containing protein [Anaerolineales bacterium]|nr:DUF6391 domain-containing protein [Anaerolineales bacterium]
MTVFETPLFRSLMNVPVVSRIRRNHGLEHATLHILSKRRPGVNIAGHSDARGFWLVGDIPIEDIHEAIEEALTRMRDGEHNLAVHQNCGTNFVTAGSLAGLAAGVAMLGAGKRVRDKVERLPMAMAMATLALILGQPLGSILQEHVTTSGNPGELRVIEIASTRRGGIQAYRVTTRG